MEILEVSAKTRAGDGGVKKAPAKHVETSHNASEGAAEATTRRLTRWFSFLLSPYSRERVGVRVYRLPDF